MRIETVLNHCYRHKSFVYAGVGWERIGRKDASPFPLTIPCGYANTSHGYIPDGPGTGTGSTSARSTATRDIVRLIESQGETYWRSMTDAALWDGSAPCKAPPIYPQSNATA